jgi:hypothetical protein
LQRAESKVQISNCKMQKIKRYKQIVKTRMQ